MFRPNRCLIAFTAVAGIVSCVDQNDSADDRARMAAAIASGGATVEQTTGTTGGMTAAEASDDGATAANTNSTGSASEEDISDEERTEADGRDGDEQPERDGLSDTDSNDDADGDDERDSLMSDPDEPAPPPMNSGASACERFCGRMNMCLYSQCPPVQAVPLEQACRPWCGGDNEEWLEDSASLSCEDFNQRIFAFSPETRALCAPREPGEDLCTEICDFGEVCGLASEDCSALCGNLNDFSRLCFAGAAQVQDCRGFFECFERDGDGGGNLCENLCFRRGRCIFNECAPGTVDAEYSDRCLEECESNQPSRREIQREFELSCEEVVREARSSNEGIDARCDAEGDDICDSLCDDRIVGCMGVNREQCLDDCTRWDRANHICLAIADDCESVQACFVSEGEQTTCRRYCDKLQGCLEEACPPQLIPSQFTDNCTANCFNEPPPVEAVDRFTDLSCRQVREETVYRGNRELRPLCEGDGDFRPRPDECAAFCDGALGQCIIGGRRFCLAACASITRDQYECALTADDDCAQIDTCLSD